MFRCPYLKVARRTRQRICNGSGRSYQPCAFESRMREFRVDCWTERRTRKNELVCDKPGLHCRYSDGFESRWGACDFVILQQFQTGFGANPASRSVGKGVLSLRLSGRRLKLPANNHLVQRLMSRDIPSLPLYSIIV